MNTTRQVQLHQVKILKQLIAFFEQEKLTYFAVSGTVLGAVRHQGFIPWDDDIDIGMPREDYERFLTMQDKLPKHLFIQHFNTESEYPLYFSKVRDTNTLFVEKRMQPYDINHGIFVDVFPWDEVLDDMSAQKQAIASASQKFRRSLLTKHKKKSAIKFAKTIFYKAIYGFKSSNQLFLNIDREYKRHNGEETARIGNAAFKESIRLKDLYPLQQLPFENITIACPNNTDRYLTELYGDYMTLPEEKDRISHNPIHICVNLNDTPTT